MEMGENIISCELRSLHAVVRWLIVVAVSWDFLALQVTVVTRYGGL